MHKVRVPATSANIGSGFDSLGLALNLYNEFCISEKSGETITICNDEVLDMPDEENLILKSLKLVLDRFEYKYEGFNIDIRGNIPMCRGLGSSATCIVAGIVIANSILGDKLSIQDIIDIGTGFEGHPDNIVPAVVGGMAVSIVDSGNVIYSKVDVPSELKFITMIPKFKISTHEARNVMPDNYIKSDCVFNISRVALLINALNKGELDKLRFGIQDKIHEPYRKKLIHGIDSIFEKCKELGSVAEFISGSGSTLIALVNKDEEKFINSMVEFVKNLEEDWNIQSLQLDLDGFKLIS